jgi:hypothetical protein
VLFREPHQKRRIAVLKYGFATEAKSDEPQVSIEADEGVFPPQTPRSPLFAMSDAEMTAIEAAGSVVSPGS